MSWIGYLQEVGGIVIGAVAGSFGTWFLGRRGARASAWRAWNDANHVVRDPKSTTNDVATTLGAAEFAFQTAGLNQNIFTVFESTASWYHDFYSTYGPDAYALKEIYDLHQRVVDLIRQRLKNPYRYRLCRHRARQIRDLRCDADEIMPRAWTVLVEMKAPGQGSGTVGHRPQPG